VTSGIRCIECGAPNRLFDAMNDSFLAIARELKLDDALKCIVDAAARLVGARFAAVGIPGEDGRFAAWITSGSPGEAPPPLDGVLAHVLTLRTTWATSDLAAEPQAGHWPEGLPGVGSLMGVPIIAEDEVLGAFYLANEDRWGFTLEDRRMIELMAPHAAVAIANARLHERSRELTVIQERTRLARELHDSVTQALFSMRLAADTTLALVDGDPDGARLQVERLRDLARGAVGDAGTARRAAAA
jgi:GAF domain-containing protein